MTFSTAYKHPLPSSLTIQKCQAPLLLTKFQLPIASIAPATSTSLSLATLPVRHGSKLSALPKEQILSSLTEAEKAIDQVQGVASNVLDTATSVFNVVSDILKPSMKAAMPLVQQAGEVAIKTASPAVSEALRKAQQAIQGTGLDTEPVYSAAKTVVDVAQETTKAIEVAKPIATSTVETIFHSDPVIIIGASGVSFLIYLITPPIWSAISFNFRGFRGSLTPAQTLDLLSTQNYTLVDIRSEKEKEKGGVPRLPSNCRNKMVPVPLEELPSKLKGIVRDSKIAEAEVTAVKISYLKRLNKSSNIVIMDSYSDSAKIVAKTLTSLGFKNCWVVTDGFSGSKGWVQSRLGTDAYKFSFAEVITPSKVISQPIARLSTTRTKFLPGAD